MGLKLARIVRCQRFSVGMVGISDVLFNLLFLVYVCFQKN